MEDRLGGKHHEVSLATLDTRRRVTMGDGVIFTLVSPVNIVRTRST